MVGPAAFVTAWVVLGTRLPGYSPVTGTISELAATDAPTRGAMTTGLVLLGTGLPLYSVALRDALPGPAWAAAALSGASTLAIAALPLTPHGDDLAHGIAAIIGYASLAAVPLLAARPLARRAEATWARSSWLAGAASGACLVASAAGTGAGLLQRVGLTVGHGWVAASALGLTGGRRVAR